MSQANIDTRYNEALQKINTFVANRNYSEAIAFVNLKKRMTNDLGNKYVVDHYEDRVIDMIKKDDSIQKYIIDKYFSRFPV